MKQYVIEGNNFKLRLSEDNIKHAYGISVDGVSIDELERNLQEHLGTVTITNVFDFENEILKG